MPPSPITRQAGRKSCESLYQPIVLGRHGGLDMQKHAKHIVDLVDAKQRQIGQMQIERQEDDLLVGTFVSGPAFPSVEQLFRDFEEAVDVQALHVIDELDDAIAILGLRLPGPIPRNTSLSRTCKFGATAASRAGSAVNPSCQ